MNTHLFIDFEHEGEPKLVSLTAAFKTLDSELARTRNLVQALRHARGQIVRDHSDHTLIDNRRREYDVAHLRLEMQNGKLLAALQQIHTAKSAVVEYIAELEKNTMSTVAIAKNNVMCAEELIDAASALYFAVRDKELQEASLAGYFFGIRNCYDKRGPGTDPREYLVAYGGYGQVDEKSVTENPCPPFMTRSEAEYAAGRWESIACTVGGAAAVYHVPSGKFVG